MRRKRGKPQGQMPPGVLSPREWGTVKHQEKKYTGLSHRERGKINGYEANAKGVIFVLLFL